MFSRRIIFWISIVITLVMYVALLWIAPRVTLLEVDKLAPRISTRFKVEFLDAAPEQRDVVAPAPGGSIVRQDIEALFTRESGTLTVEDSLALPPIETPQLAERLAEETVERSYDFTPEQERSRIMDTRILEITAEDARREINVPRRLVRPGPKYVLPMEAVPALRGSDVKQENIALQPARFGTGLLARAVPMPEDALEGTELTKPPFEDVVTDGEQTETRTSVTQLEQVVVQTPLKKETQKAREESTYSFLDEMVDIHLETYVTSPEEPGYFRLRILPRKNAALELLPRDFIFVVDASRSVQQRKLNQVARGISDALPGFRPEDRFNIMLFRDTVTLFQTEAVYASPENITAGQVFLKDLESRGQTDVYNALLPIARLTPRPNLPGIVLLASDGVPTAGVRDSRTIINTITEDNALRNSVFAYGVGNSVDRYLLDLLAYRNKGEAFVSTDIQRARGDIAAFIDRFANPVLVNLNAEYGQAVHGDVYPRVMPDFYQERPIVLYGRFAPGTDEVFTARITGRAGEASKELVFRTLLSEAEKGGKDIAQAWAFEKAYDIIGEISEQGENPMLLDELRQISQRYSIRTIYDEK
ncbi:MAG: VWA domain-containing protein [Candidatus Hydrogenedentes bacterium]|nr:VWA domain-containing protein [Candidatus Hydrogenedentota bacterium]